MSAIVREAQTINSIMLEYKDIWSNTRKLKTDEDLRFLKIFSVKLATQHIPADVVRAAMNILSCREVFFPSLAQIICTCEMVINRAIENQLLDADEAWSLIIESIKNGGHIPWTPHMKNAVEYIGGLAMISQCRMESVSVLRAQFKSGYESSVRREKNNKEFEQAVSVLPVATRHLLLNAGKTID